MKRSFPMMLPALLLVWTGTSRVAQAQQGDPGADRPQMRQAIQQRLDKLHEQEQRLEDALAQLDAGADPQELREQFERHENAGRPGADKPGQARSPVTEQELLDVLRRLDAPMADRIARALERNPERARQQLRRIAPRLRELVQLKRENPDAFEPRVRMQKAGRDAFHAAQRLQHTMQDDAGEPIVEESKAAVLEAISRRVDAEVDFREAMLSGFTRRLESMRDEVATLRATRQQQIVERMDSLLQRLASGQGVDAAALGGEESRRSGKTRNPRKVP